MTSEVNYKNKKRYVTAKYPIRQPKFFVWLIWLLSKILTKNVDYKIEKVNMEGLTGPYMILSNHMHFIDFELVAMITGSRQRVNSVVSIDGFYRRPWLLELIGAIATRKYTMDLHLIKSIRKVLSRGDVLCMYPEARYSPAGITSYIPETVGMLVKRNKIPVVAIVHHGNYLRAPFWSYRKKRNVPLHTVATQILTAEQVEKMSAEEINEAIREALTYDEYAYQKENGILIKEDFRAEGLHKILYQCPACGVEHKMESEGTEIFCSACGKRWTLREDGELEAKDGVTEFSRVPDWFLWEREQVKKQIEEGSYSFSDEVEVYSMPRCWKFETLGKARVTHDIEKGFTIEGEYNGQAYKIERAPIQMNALHVEYDYCYIKPLDCFDISTEDDSFYCYPLTKKNVLTKLAFATEILYEKHAEASKKTRRTRKMEN